METAKLCQTAMSAEFIAGVDSTLESAEYPAANGEKAKPSQAATPGKEVSRPKSAYHGSEGNTTESTCMHCGGSEKHADCRECPAWVAKCSCGLPHYYQHL